MKIGIDARLINQTGVGRYIRNLVYQLSEKDHKNIYYLYLYHDAYTTYVPPQDNWHKVLLPYKWHTLEEQIRATNYYYRDRLDLLHVPYFNVPYLYNRKFIVTIHDLTIMKTDTGQATTLSPVLYYIKRLGYQLILNHAIRKSAHILTVSNAVKSDIIRYFEIDPNKITVIYEGVDPVFLRSDGDHRKADKPYILYVGNAYPHKNLDVLFKGMEILAGRLKSIPELYLVGPDDYFYRRLRLRSNSAGYKFKIRFINSPDDTELKSLYRNAVCLVFPSSEEGFGLPALEALACGCPVIVSDIGVFHEILSDSADYFPATDAAVLADLIAKKITYPSVKARNTELLKNFNWAITAEKTLKIYEGFK